MPLASILFWSRRGEVACDVHAPDRSSKRWGDEGWAELPPRALIGRVTYQCQHCEGGPIRHVPRDTSAGPLILNVDDRPPTLYARGRLLRLHGFSVVNASTGASALEAAERLHPSLVLLDVHLPDIDGREVCQRLKRNAELSSIPVVLISATLSGSSSEIASAGFSGADDFIAEPITPASLVARLRQVIRAQA